MRRGKGPGGEVGGAPGRGVGEVDSQEELMEQCDWWRSVVCVGDLWEMQYVCWNG